MKAVLFFIVGKTVRSSGRHRTRSSSGRGGSGRVVFDHFGGALVSERGIGRTRSGSKIVQTFHFLARFDHPGASFLVAQFFEQSSRIVKSRNVTLRAHDGNLCGRFF